MKAFLIPPRLLWVPPCSVTYYRYVYECVSTHPQVYICMKASGWQKISFSNTVLRLVFVYSLSLKLELIHLGRLIGQEALGIHLLLSSRRVTTTYHCDLLYMDKHLTNWVSLPAHLLQFGPQQVIYPLSDSSSHLEWEQSPACFIGIFSGTKWINKPIACN